MNMQATAPRRRPRGFSLIELMVGLVIGMIAIFVMMQTMQVSEGFKRTAVGGSDAHTGGAIALDLLQRQIANAGYGIASESFLSCSVTLPTGVVLTNVGGVTINHPQVPAGDANTDTLLVVYGTNSALVEGDWVNSVTGTVLSVATPTLHALGDWVMFAEENAIPDTPCALTSTLQTITAAAAPGTATLQVGTAIAPTGSGSGMLINLGANARIVGYAVRGGSLTTCDYLVANCTGAAAWTETEPHVVNLRAEYGRDTTLPLSDGTIDLYDQTGATDACDWLRVPALRLVLVTRSEQFEKTAVTGVAGGQPAPTWRGNAAIDLTGDANWQRYRYRTLETTVPLRSISILGARKARNLVLGDGTSCTT